MAEKFGAGVMIYGTLFTGLIAIIVALPMSFGIAFFLTEIAPPKLRRPIGMAIQLLAAVPSIIFGMWGFFVVVPLIATYLQPPLIAAFGHVPLLSFLFKGPPLGSGMLTAGMILAFMIIPFITAMFVEIIESVPPMLKESAYGVGATTFEVFRNVSVPYGADGAGRRRDARPRSRPRRDHGGDLRDRQCDAHLGLSFRAGRDHRLDHRQRVHRSRHRDLQLHSLLELASSFSSSPSSSSPSRARSFAPP